MIEKDLLRSVASPIVLRLVSEKAMYGYEIIKAVQDRTNGEFVWKEGTLYPLLHRLEGAGWIDSEWRDSDEGRGRKYYRITRAGSTELAERLHEWQGFTASVNLIFFAPPAKGRG
jgi:PadR family transcriptional regulator, regulatory protein PadR